MPPKRNYISTSTSKPSTATNERVIKRFKRTSNSYATLGAPGLGDETSRLIAAHHQQEHAGGGLSYLSVRGATDGVKVPSLKESSLRVAAKGLLQNLKLPTAPNNIASSSPRKSDVGWDVNNRHQQQEIKDLRNYIKELPSELSNRLLTLVLRESVIELDHLNHNQNDMAGVSVLALAALFLHPNTTKLSLTSLSAPTLLLSKIPQCTSLTDLDLSTHTQLSDLAMSKILMSLPTLQKINLRGCTKVGDLSVIALSKSTEDRLNSANLSLTAVTIKGLTSLFARCSNLQVLKIANVQALNDRNMTKLLDDSIHLALGWRHIPLSQLRSLKVRSTDVTDNSLGRLLSLCASTLERLDISYTSIKSLDLVSRALHIVPEWKLEKLVASGLPLAPTTLEGFFKPLSERQEEERKRFKVLKLGSIPSTSTKQPGLTDSVLARLLPYLKSLTGLERISFFQNWHLGLKAEPMSEFIRSVGRGCTSLDLTIPIQSYHLDGLLPALEEDGEVEAEQPKLQTLVLDSSKITDEAKDAIGECRQLRTLHVAETKVSTKLLSHVLKRCPQLNNLNLTSCRGIPVAQRRTFFEAWSRGDVDVTDC